jgi:hypothetical protein
MFESNPKLQKVYAARLCGAGGSALTTKYNRGVEVRTRISGESNDSTEVAFVLVPTRMATALARPRGGRTRRSVSCHDRTSAPITQCPHTTWFWFTPTNVGRDCGSRNGVEVLIRLLKVTDVRYLVATVVSRAVL